MTEIKAVNRDLKGIKISHKKEAIFDVQLDLTRFVTRALNEADQSSSGTTYLVCSTGGSLKLTAPGFEDCTVSINVMTNKAKYDQKSAFIKQQQDAQAELATRQQERAILDKLANIDPDKLAKLLASL